MGFNDVFSKKKIDEQVLAISNFMKSKEINIKTGRTMYFDALSSLGLDVSEIYDLVESGQEKNMFIVVCGTHRNVQDNNILDDDIFSTSLFTYNPYCDFIPSRLFGLRNNYVNLKKTSPQKQIKTIQEDIKNHYSVFNNIKDHIGALCNCGQSQSSMSSGIRDVLESCTPYQIENFLNLDLSDLATKYFVPEPVFYDALTIKKPTSHIGSSKESILSKINPDSYCI